MQLLIHASIVHTAAPPVRTMTIVMVANSQMSGDQTVSMIAFFLMVVAIKIRAAQRNV